MRNAKQPNDMLLHQVPGKGHLLLYVYMFVQAFFWFWFAPFLPVTDSVRQDLLDISTLPVCQKDVTWGLTLIKYKCWGKRRRFRPVLSGIPWQRGIISWKRERERERCDCTVNVDVFLRVCWSGPSQAVGSERQHHRVPPEERGPWYRVCPDSLRAVWTCGGAWYLCYLQNLWVPIFSRSLTHLKYCGIYLSV